MEEEINQGEFMEDPQTAQLKGQNLELQQALAGSQMFNDDNENLIMYQLETDKILERIEHFLRGDEIKVKDGNSYYVQTKDPSKQNFNDYGVSELMRIVSMYVTKETFLSLYDIDRINEILGDLGDALSDFIYCNMHRMGMDTKFKQSKFSLIVLDILHTIESCYRRALKGFEQQNIRSRSIVTQTSSSNPNQMNNNPRRGFNPFQPKSW